MSAILNSDLSMQYVFTTLAKQSSIIDQMFSQIDTSLTDMQRHRKILLETLTQLKQLQGNNCPDRVCKCDKGMIWDPVANLCKCPPDLIWDDDLKECRCSVDVPWDPITDECICPDIQFWNPVTKAEFQNNFP